MTAKPVGFSDGVNVEGVKGESRRTPEAWIRAYGRMSYHQQLSVRGLQKKQVGSIEDQHSAQS